MPCVRSWWECAQDLLPEEADAARRGHHTALLEEVETNWDLPNWASNVEQCVSQNGHALANIHSLPKFPSRGRSHQYGGTSYIGMQKVGCALIRNVRETRESLPTGFRHRDPAPESHLTLIKLAELLRDLSRLECRADSDMVGSDIRTILASEGDLATRSTYAHSRLFRRRQVGRGRFSPLMAFDEAFGEWEARTGDCRPPALVPPGQGLFVSAADTQAITELALQGAWHRLRQRRQDKPDLLAPWHWLSPRKEWILPVALVEKLKLPQYGWTSVANYWCPHYNMGTWCTTGTHATFIPPEDNRDTEKVILDSQAEVLKWSTDFSGDEIDREDGSGLEFECQLNTPSLARLHPMILGNSGVPM